MFPNKAITGIVATSLLLIVTVFSVIAFQKFYFSYTSELTTSIDVDKSLSLTNNIVLDKFFENKLYVINNGNGEVPINSIKLNNINCSYSIDKLAEGMNSILIMGCYEGISGLTELLFETDKDVYSKYFYISDEFENVSLACSGLCSYLDVLVNSGVSVGEAVNISVDYYIANISVSGETLDISKIGNIIWTTDVEEGGIVREITADDLNNDGNSDIIVGEAARKVYNDGNLYLLDKDGNKLNSRAGYSYIHILAIGDVTGDDKKEIVYLYDSVDKPLTVLDSNLSYLKSLSGNYENAAIADLNGDGINDIFAYDADNDIGSKAYNPSDNYAVLYTTNTNLNNPYGTFCGIIDGNKDGVGDIIVFSSYYSERFLGFDFSGNLVINYTPSGDPIYTNPCIVGDFNEDGYVNEIILNHHYHAFEVLNATGDIVLSKSLGVSSFYGDIIDIDKDGFEDDFVIYFSSYIKAYDNGINYIWGYNFPNLVDMVTGDLNNDGEMDIIATNGTNLIILNLNGTLRKNYDNQNIRTLSNVIDVDGDGLNDILLGISNGNAGVVLFQEVDCRVNFNDGSYDLVWDDDSKIWKMSRTFSSSGSYDYSITCSKDGYSSITKSGTVIVS